MLFPASVAQTSVWRKFLQPLNLVAFVSDPLGTWNQKISSLGTAAPGAVAFCQASNLDHRN